MCGRYTLYSDMTAMEARFEFRGEGLSYRPSYNIAPTQEVLTVVNDGMRHGRMMKWGLIPSWSKDGRPSYSTINAKAETLATSRLYAPAYKKRRCLVLASGFYEWRKEGATKTPVHIRLKSDKPFAFAGLWDFWKSPEDKGVFSCTIVTTTPNAVVRPIHDRMPVILSREAEALWLDPMTSDAKVLDRLLIPFTDEPMVAYEVPLAVGNVRNNTPDLVKPAS
ncbi:MAG: SOS response-associated peptidase [Chloroflexi bacterium]|nr:SOS response-associated peptidase [Chloroflexota bacterium]